MKNWLVAVVIVAMMIIGSAPLLTTHDRSSPSPALASAYMTNGTEGYTHQVYTGLFDETDQPPTTGSVRVENVATEWGKFGLDKGDYAGKSISQLYWGGVSIPCHVRYYDVYVNYWYYNGTSKAARPFANYWGNFVELRNDTNVGIWQYQAQAPDFYSGTAGTWNMTVRFTVLKFEPYIKLDLWLRYPNASAKIQKLDVKPCYYEGGTDYTASYDSNMRMSYRVANDGSYAVGHVAYSVANAYGNAGAAMGMFTQNRTQMVRTEDWHMSSVIIVGQDLSDLREKASRLGSEWFTEYEKTDYNLVVAYNEDSIDCLRFFPDSGYEYVPTGENETVIATGTVSERTFALNPLLSYRKIPVVTDIDDSYYGFGVNQHWDWYYNTSEAYGIATTFPTEWAYVLPSYMSSLMNLSEKREGTLYEMGEHGWNHTGLYTYQSYSYQYTIWELSEQRWEANSSYELLSQAFPGNAWSYVTFEAMGTGGCQNIRGNVLGNEYLAPFDFDYGAGEVWICSFTDLLAYKSSPGPGTQQTGRAYGYLFMQGHTIDFDTEGERALVLSWWQYLQNNSADFATMTHAQFSDIWHHRIACYDQEGQYVVDLSAATVNHRLMIGSVNGSLPLFWDVTANEAVTVETTTSEESILYAQKGHVYKAVAGVVIEGDSAGIVSLETYDNATLDPLATISANLTEGPLTIYLYGLGSSGSFQVSIDGDQDSALLYADEDGTLEYTYDSDWSTHTFVFEPSYLTELTGVFVPVFAAVIVISIMTAMIGVVIDSRKKK